MTLSYISVTYICNLVTRTTERKSNLAINLYNESTSSAITFFYHQVVLINLQNLDIFDWIFLLAFLISVSKYYIL